MLAAGLILLLIPWGGLVWGWQLRNYSVSNSFRLSHIIGWNLLFCRGATIIGEHHDMSYNEARAYLGINDYRIQHPETHAWSVAQLDRRWQKEGLDIIRAHPLLFIRTLYRGCLKMLLGTGEATVLNDYFKQPEPGPLRSLFSMPFQKYIHSWLFKRPGIWLLFCLAQGVLLVLYFCLGHLFWNTLHRSRGLLGKITNLPLHGFLWMILLYMILLSISTGPEAYSRFRIPIMPLLVLYAGRGLYYLVSTGRQMRQKIFSQ